MPILTYQHDGETFRSRVHGEGVVKWIDHDNVIYERQWWRVAWTSEAGDRITIARFRMVDGEVTMPRQGPLPPSVSRTKYRPKATVDMAAVHPWKAFEEQEV